MRPSADLSLLVSLEELRISGRSPDSPPGIIGKDFDFTGQTLGVLPDRPTAIQQPARQHQPPVVEPHRGYNPPIEPSPQQRARLPAEISQNGRTHGVAPSGSTEPMWAAKHQSRPSETSLRHVDPWASQGATPLAQIRTPH